MWIWVKVFRINPKFRILRLTFLGKSASKCWIREIILAPLVGFQIIKTQSFKLEIILIWRHPASFKIWISKVQDFRKFWTFTHVWLVDNAYPRPMGESSKFFKSWTFEIQNSKPAVCLQKNNNFKLNDQLTYDILKCQKVDKRICYNLNSAFWGRLYTECQPQNPEFRKNPEKFSPMIPECWDW